MGMPHSEYGALGCGFARGDMAQCHEAWSPKLLARFAFFNVSIPSDILDKYSSLQIKVIILFSDNDMLLAVKLYR